MNVLLKHLKSQLWQALFMIKKASVCALAHTNFANKVKK
jgi:hypothetical protein